MDIATTRMLRAEMQRYVARDNRVACAAIVVDFAVFVAATSLAVIVEPVVLKALAAIVAGTMIATLFVLGHDATHGSLVVAAWHNRVLARLLFLPALHNYTLWRIEHNRLHHRTPNVRGVNSWAPLSPREFRALPQWRKALERVYRGGGFGLYYLIERWWKHKLFPRTSLDARVARAAWSDFALIVVGLLAWTAGVLALGRHANQPWPSALAWGIVLPYLVWNWNMGLTVFLHHTHFAVRWFGSEGDADGSPQEELTIHVRYPRWYGWLSHEIMEHPAHHLNPLIPFYRLHDAQTRLVELLGERAIVEPMSFRYVASLMRRCKLYDYERDEWTDFSGRVTGQDRSSLAVARHTP